MDLVPILTSSSKLWPQSHSNSYTGMVHRSIDPQVFLFWEQFMFHPYGCQVKIGIISGLRH
jgi:hypothetical protein